MGLPFYVNGINFANICQFFCVYEYEQVYIGIGASFTSCFRTI